MAASLDLAARFAAVSLDLDGDRAWFADHGRRQHRCRPGFPEEGGAAVLVFVRRLGSGLESFAIGHFEGETPAAIDFAGEEYLCRAAFAAFVGAGGKLRSDAQEKTPPGGEAGGVSIQAGGANAGGTFGQGSDRGEHCQ